MVKKKGMPQWNEIVLCTVTRVTPYAAWCTLDEYEERIEGMIHVSEVSGRWVKDIRDFVKPNKRYVVRVVRIDQERGTINLSLKRISKNDEREKMNAFRREQRAEKILEHAAQELNKTLEQAYKEVGFLLQEKFSELFVAFEEAKASPDVLTESGVSKEWSEAIMKIVEKSFKEKEFTIVGEVELTSYDNNGVQKIKDVLNDLTKKTGVNVKYISAPRYRVELKTKDPKNTEKMLKDGLNAAVKSVDEGNYKLV